ncbi:MAG: Crp/Fnr family transcriptional regulator [Candidatus Adiutrix sp.]|jgi:CRP/FNR family transcriptional regulator|nr:Crp/Fnr family transcriptional regulator [Candidatus Adiutrix sp.]
MSLAESIGRAAFFSGLEPELIEQLASIAAAKSYQAGEVVFNEGDPGLGFHLLVEGRVKIYKSSPDGKEQLLHLFGPGEPFGEVAIFLGRGYPAQAQALSDCRTAFFPREALRRLISQNPDLAFGLMAVLAQRLTRFAGLLETITLKEVPARLAAFLLDLAGTGPAAELGVSKSQLASLLGATPETISRAFGRLKSAGLISEEKTAIKITDRRRLRQVADGLDKLKGSSKNSRNSK